MISGWFFKIFFLKGLFLTQRAILWLAFVPREAGTLLQSTAEGLDFKEWVFIICVLPCLCHMAHWGDIANVLVYELYLHFRESLCLNVSGLQVTG